jgi:anti-sigma regulatory factor (Ser/Thr protein kinase)
MSSLRSSRPPSGCTEVGSWTLGDSRQLSALRHSLQDALDGGRDELDEVPEKVALVASELATNALRHGLPPTVVRLLRSDEAFVLDVADHDTGVIPQPEDEESDSEGGRGLQIARRLALDVGWYAADTTKHVWAQFAAPARETP